ncbi:MAG TPA: hypothetical protein VM261_08150 [Kofleriaceae bacterium]|nr:hypothetical protein [Kofleriaceae bacterium]
MDRRGCRSIAFALACCAAGCASGSSASDDDDDPTPDARTVDATPAVDAPIVVIDAQAQTDAATTDAATTDGAIDAGTTTAVIFANTQTALYRIDPVTYAAALVGSFGWPASVGSDAMADIAIAPDGAIIGASNARLYRCSATTAACTLVGALAQTVNALGYAPPGTVEPGVDTLVGAKSDGALYRIDTTTAAMTSLGHFSTGHASSGDVAYVAGSLVAAINPGGTNDSLARINATTGATTLVGPTSRPWLWGLAAAGPTLLGFTLDRTIVTINTTTGATAVVATGAVDWYGAAGR